MPSLTMYLLISTCVALSCLMALRLFDHYIMHVLWMLLLITAVFVYRADFVLFQQDFKERFAR